MPRPHYVLDHELKQAVQQVVRQFQNSFEPRPKRGRRAAGGGGGSTAITSQFAVVTDAAGASTHGSSGITLGDVGKCYLLDEDGAVTTSDPADKIEFKSLHRVGIPVDTIIELSAPKDIAAGSTWDENKVLGRFVDVVDELWQQAGRAPKKAWAIPADATEATDQQWLGAEC